MSNTNKCNDNLNIQQLNSNGQQYPPQSGRLYFNLSIFWFALSFLWAGMITIVIQGLVAEMAGKQKDLYLGWILAIGALISTVVVIVVGAISDRSRWAMGRRRPYMIIGTLLSVPSLLWLAHVHSIPLLILDYGLIQLCVNFATSPYQALIPDLVPKNHQGTASAYMGTCSLIGQLGGLTLCGLIISRYHGLNTTALNIIVATFSVALVAAMVYVVWKAPERSASGNTAPASGLMNTIAGSFKVKPSEHPDFFRLIISRFVNNMGFYTATEFLLYYVQDTLHVANPYDVMKWILLIATVSGLIGNIPAGILADRISKKLIIYIAAGITSTAALIFLLSQSIAGAYVAAFIFGIGLGMFLAVDWAFATSLLPERDEAKYMGIWHVAFTVPQVVAPLIGGLVAYFFNQQIGQGFGYRVVMFLVIAYMIAGTLLVRPIRERRAEKSS